MCATTRETQEARGVYLEYAARLFLLLEAFRLPEGFLRGLVSLGGMLHGLAGMFVGAQVIFFLVMGRGYTVCVSGEIVKLRGATM